ncbi:hypothetical protein BN6_38170 [Saccharothrix espanaensis DSM 44229]|uniref:Uncharacterized protein n=1 Tax=Saccharothrix espanaensis (strain ATCC 51144 / DSM 44229 / JCM 9112 / NBRC 15066 / NRRL 15764) TaxID=1179773 RepID=K0K3M2_SACES|nr:hypothetical protein BN6_38170 [Saccharothrix espanaensis DSM 44229]
MSQANPDLPGTRPRPKKGAGVIVLLVLMSLANTFTLVIGIAGMVDEIEHGRDWDDDELRLAAFVTIMSLIAVTALVGAWLTRKWGPRLYVAATGLGLVIGLVITGGASFSPISLVGIALAAALWITAENNW